MRLKWFFAVLALATLAGCASGSANGSASNPARSFDGPLKIVIVGDSTVANYPATVPDRGWGQFIGEYFKADIAVVNTARNGRSAKTFIGEGLWDKALAEKPNLVLIQFGHNDSHAPTQPEATNAATDFRDYLRKYIDQSRAIGAEAVLVTPVQRRTYKPDGVLDNTLLPYADAMKAVGAEKRVAVIDLNATSGRLYERLGENANATVSRNGTDTTHFNERGARWMAALVMRDLVKAEPGLSARLKPGGDVPGEIDISR